MRIFFWIAGLFLLFFVVIPGVSIGAYFWRFYAPLPTAEPIETENVAEARAQDLAFLARLTDIDHSFSSAQEAAFHTHLAEMNERAGTMSEAEFVTGVAAAVALTGNGHTNMRLRSMSTRLGSLPVRFTWFADGLYIVRARAAHSDLIGSRVIAYDGAPPEDLIPVVAQFIGGNAAFQRYESVYFFAAPAAMHVAGLARAPDAVTLDLEAPDGTASTITLPIEETATYFMRASDHAYAVAVYHEDDSGHDWRFLDPGTTEATYYGRHPGVDLWSEDLPGEGMIIRMRSIGGADAEGTSFSGFVAALAADLRENPARYLVLDLRGNGGGDLTLAMGFARNVTEYVIPEGRVYILTDGGTFSAAIVTAAYAVHDAGDRGMIVGSTMGDDEQFWAEGSGLLRLPQSGLAIGVSTGYHDWENGCSDWSTCYWLAIVMGVAAGPLDPDIEAPLSFADYSRGVDTGMEAIFAAEGIARP